MNDEIVKIERPDPPAEIWVSILKSAFGAVPVVGQALMEVVFDGRSRIKQERINNFFKDSAEEIRRTIEHKIDFEFIKSEEFSDLLEDILHKISSNKSKAKQEHFKRLFLQAVEGHRPPDMSQTFINILGEITDAELALLAEIYNIYNQGLQLQKEGKKVDNTIHLKKDQTGIFGIDRTQYLLMVQSMIRKGILYDESLGRADGHPYEVIGINELGLQFCEYITRI